MLFCKTCRLGISTDQERTMRIRLHGGRQEYFHRDCPNKHPREGKPATAAKQEANDRKRTGPTESDVSRSCAKILDDREIWNTRTQSGKIKTIGGHVMQLCKTGTPDRVFNYIVNVWIEFKRPGEKPSPEQTATIAKLRENGSLAFVVDNVSDFDLILRAIKARQARLLEIGERIRDIQGEIDAELLTQNYGKKQKHNPHI